MGKASIIYPRYIDSEASLKDGRRLGREQSVPQPSLAEIAEAIQKLYPSANIQTEPEKRYPRGAVENYELGYLKIDKETIKAAGGKLRLLKSLQNPIVEARQQVIEILAQAENKEIGEVKEIAK